MNAQTHAKKKPRFIRPPNILKQKVGTGGIDEKLLLKSQKFIEEEANLDFLPYARDFLNQLAAARKEAQANQEDIKTLKEKIIKPVMQLKANGGMFKYQLVSDVADIALQFLEALDTMNNDVFDVLKAHENSLNAIIKSELKGDGGNEGYALVKELDQACKRYFSKHGKNKV